MPKEWITGKDGYNLKFKRETLLNYGMNRWRLNKAYSVGPTPELIRACASKTFEEWKNFYLTYARQKKKDGVRSIIDHKIEPAPDEWDRTYGVDSFIKLKNGYVGIQIKPIRWSGRACPHADRHSIAASGMRARAPCILLFPFPGLTIPTFIK